MKQGYLGVQSIYIAIYSFSSAYIAIYSFIYMHCNLFDRSKESFWRIDLIVPAAEVTVRAW
jgi:hypothetical protein